MAFSSGTYSLYTPGNPVVTGTTIASTWANNTLNDIATALSTCLLKDGTQTVTANIPMGGFKFTGLAAGSATGNSLRYDDVFTAAVADIPMNSHKLTGLAAGTAAGHSIRWEQSAAGVVTTAGDIVQATGAGAITRLGIGAAGSLLAVNAGATAVAYQAMATQADQETGTSVLAPVTPGRQQYHPSAVKGWCRASIAGTAVGSYNVTSVTDSGTGDVSVNWTVAFSGTTYSVVVTAKTDAPTTHLISAATTSQSVSVSRALSQNSATTATDPDEWFFMACGDQ